MKIEKNKKTKKIKKFKSNFLKIKETTSVLKNESIWGYPFKLEDGKTVFKLVDDKIKAPNKLPGRIVSQIAKKNSVRAFLRIYFKKNYDILMEEDSDIDNQSKSFLYLLIEMIIRNKEKFKTNDKNIFIPYDLIFLKYIE